MDDVVIEDADPAPMVERDRERQREFDVTSTLLLRSQGTW